MGFLAGIVVPYPHLGAIRVIYRWRRQGSAGGEHTSGESPGKAHARVLAGSLFPGGLLAHNTKTVLCLHIPPGVLQASFRYLLVGSCYVHRVFGHGVRSLFGHGLHGVLGHF